MSAITRRLADDLRPLPLALPAIGLVGIVVAALTWAFDNTTYDTWAGVVVLILLGVISVPVVRAMARHEDDPRIARLFGYALVLKMVGALARFATDFGIYDGTADSALYHATGVELAPHFRQLDFASPADLPQGTAFIGDLTGWLYVFTGPTKLGAFFLLSWLGFLGLYFFYRAFALAIPEGDSWRYARLVLLLPSLLFWASGLGKDSWMSFMLGTAALGAARLFTGRRGGITMLLVGVAGLGAVRPHVAALLIVSAFVAYVLRRTPVANRSILRPLVKVVGIVMLGGALIFVVGFTEDFLGADETSSVAVGEVLDRTRSQTSIGGSNFVKDENTDLRPTAFPSAMVNVMFRPFPWEAENLQSVIAALEGSALLALFLGSWRRLAGAVRIALQRPYMLLCCTYSVTFIYGFSSFANFGILTRQRVQLFPFVLVLVCVPAWRREQGGWRSLLAAEEPATADEPATMVRS